MKNGLANDIDQNIFTQRITVSVRRRSLSLITEDLELKH